MKHTIICSILLMLTGCTLDPKYQTALNNYAKANCNGKLLAVTTKTTLDPTTSAMVGFECVEDTGIKTYWIKIKEIPQKYWEIE